MNARYGRERIKKNLLYFILGKGASAIAGFAVMVLIVRELSVEAFGAYSVLIALVEMFTAISGLGIAHAVLRYVPELYSKNYHHALKAFLTKAILLRFLVLFAAIFFAYYFSELLSSFAGLSDVLSAFKLFLVVVFFRVFTHFLAQILESTLHQSIVQAGFLTATLARLLGIIYIGYLGEVTLLKVIWVEVVAEIMSVMCMIYGIIRFIFIDKSASQGSEDSQTWLTKHFRKIIKFAVAGYLQHLAILPYGSSTNRLVGGNMLSISTMASFGFAQSIYEYIKRYMPAILLVGLIRPVIVARYSQEGDFPSATDLCNQLVQVNVLLILGITVPLIVGGTDLLMLISDGKYGQGSVLLLLALLVVLSLETQREQLEMLVQTVERYQFLITSNIILSTSILLAVALVPSIGAVAFPVANAIGLVIANYWVNKKMALNSFVFKHSWKLTLRSLAICALSSIIGLLLKLIGIHWFFAILVSMVAYILLVYLFCKALIVDFVQNLTGAR